MSQYTEVALERYLKRNLILIFLLWQNTVTEDNNSVLQEMHKFKDNFIKLQVELVVTQCVNSEPCKKSDNGESVQGKYLVLKKRMFRDDWNTSTS